MRNHLVKIKLLMTNNNFILTIITPFYQGLFLIILKIIANFFYKMNKRIFKESIIIESFIFNYLRFLWDDRFK